MKKLLASPFILLGLVFAALVFIMKRKAVTAKPNLQNQVGAILTSVPGISSTDAYNYGKAIQSAYQIGSGLLNGSSGPTPNIAQPVVSPPYITPAIDNSGISQSGVGLMFGDYGSGYGPGYNPDGSAIDNYGQGTPASNQANNLTDYSNEALWGVDYSQV